jgi:hypothetical protein
MPAHEGGSAPSGAGVRKPPRKPREGARGWRGVDYGDLSAADEVCERGCAFR